MRLKFGKNTFFEFNNLPAPIAQILQQEGLIYHKTDEITDNATTFNFVKDIGGKKSTIIQHDGVGSTDGRFFIYDATGKKIITGHIFFSNEKGIIFVEESIGAALFLRVFEDILKIKLLGEGRILCHAASFKYQDKGVLLLGWDGTGKTPLLLYFLQKGAHYLGDDRTMLGKDAILNPFIKRPRLFWHEAMKFKQIFDEIPIFNRLVFRLLSMSGYLSSLNNVYSKVDRFLNYCLRSYRFVTFDISKFMVSESASLDVAIILFRSNRSDIYVDGDKNSRDIIEMLTNNILWMDYRLLQTYYAYCFLFPRYSMNSCCENYQAEVSRILRCALENKSIYFVNVPLSLNTKRLGDVLEECIIGN